MPTADDPRPQPTQGAAARTARVRHPRRRARRYGRSPLRDFFTANAVPVRALAVAAVVLVYFRPSAALTLAAVALGCAVPPRATLRGLAVGAGAVALACSGPVSSAAMSRAEMHSAGKSPAETAGALGPVEAAGDLALGLALAAALVALAVPSLRELDRRRGSYWLWAYLALASVAAGGAWLGGLGGAWRFPGLTGLSVGAISPRAPDRALPPGSAAYWLAAGTDHLFRLALGLPLGIAVGGVARWFRHGTTSPVRPKRAARPPRAAGPATAPGAATVTHRTASPTPAGTNATLDSPGDDSGPPIEAVEAPPPDFGDFELLEEVGHGGMGRVYKARQKSLNRVVALKTIKAGQLAGSVSVERFRAEAEAVARLDHSGIVPVYGFGQHDGQHFFTMAFVEGGTLGARLAGGTLDGPHAAFVVQKSAEAVAFAHGRGIVHRDVKPGNILLDRDGTVRVADFGLAKRLGAADLPGDDPPADFPFADTYHTVQRLTQTGAVMGTPSYMAPEQALDAARVGPAADIWALGAVLYACLTGRPPFLGATGLETVTLVIETDPVPPRDLNPAVDRDLEAVCLKCLRKKPDERYGSAAELAEDLGRYRAGQTPRAARVHPLERLRRLDAAYPEALPVLAGLVAARLGNLPEGLFVGCAVAGMALPLRRPAPQSVAAWAVVVALLTAAGPLVGLMRVDTPDPGVTRAALRTGFALSLLAGAAAGAVLAVGARCADDAEDWPGLPAWGFRGCVVVAVLGAAATAALWGYTETPRFQAFPEDVWHARAVRAVFPWAGAVASWLLAVPLGLSAGVLVGGAARWLGGPSRFALRWAGPTARLAAAVAALGVLAALAEHFPAGRPPELATLEYFGPGPLLTTLEWTVTARFGLPVLTAWPVVLLGKFALVAVLMTVAAVAVTATLRGRLRVP